MKCGSNSSSVKYKNGEPQILSRTLHSDGERALTKLEIL